MRPALSSSVSALRVAASLVRAASADDEKLLVFLDAVGAWRDGDGPEPDWDKLWPLRRRLQEKLHVKALPEALEAAVLAIVTEQYTLWKQGRLREEPRLTAALMREWVPHDVSPAWSDLPKKKQTALVENALARLKKRGKLKTSVGAGLDGREARLWEPA